MSRGRLDVAAKGCLRSPPREVGIPRRFAHRAKRTLQASRRTFDACAARGGGERVPLCFPPLAHRSSSPARAAPARSEAFRDVPTRRDVLDDLLDDARDLEEMVGRKRWGVHGVKHLPKVNTDEVANYVLPVTATYVGLIVGNDIVSCIGDRVGGVVGTSKHDEGGCE